MKTILWMERAGTIGQTATNILEVIPKDSGVDMARWNTEVRANPIVVNGWRVSITDKDNTGKSLSLFDFVH